MTASRNATAIWLIALIPLALHLWPNPVYGYFGDELYYLACAWRLDLGYVDHPPLSIWLLGLWTALCGDSVFALRVLPALLSAGLVLLTARIAARLGGGSSARTLAALVAAFAPGYLAIFDFYSMNALEVVLWTGIAYLLLARIQDDRPTLWPWIGVLFGIAALNKHTMILYAAGLGLGLLLTPLRRDLLDKRLWAGAAIAALLCAPNLIWQLQNDWPSLEFYRNAHLGKNVDQPISGILIGQALSMGPLGFPLVLLGLASLLLRRAHRSGQLFFWCYAVLLLSMITSGSSRPDRIAGGYPMLIAAGAAWLDGLANLHGIRWRRTVAFGAVILVGVLMLPITVAAVPVELSLRYTRALGSLLVIERGKPAELPLWFAYRRGWPELAQGVADACAQLTPEERERCVIYTSSYGRAGALELYGRAHDLPPVICPHNSYYGWSLGKGHSDVYVVVDLGRNNLDVLFEEVAVTVTAWNGTTYPIYIARGPRATFDEVWNQLRVYQ